MTSKRLYIILLACFGLLIVVGVMGVWFGSKFLKKQAAEISALKVESIVLEEQQRSLVQAKKDIQTYAELEQIAKTIVPQDKDQARTVRELIKIAGESGVRISAISFPTSTLGQAAKPTTTAPTNNEGESTPSAPQPATPAAPKTTQVKAVEGIPGLFKMEISVQSDPSTPVQYSNLIAFLRKLEQNRRTAQVSNLTVTPSTDNRSLVTFNVLLNVYIKP